MTGNRNYANGANFERRIKVKLEADGYTVFRTAGSHTPCDLIAIWPKKRIDWSVGWADLAASTVFVQAKGGVSPMTKKQRATFAEFAKAHGARPLLVTRGMNFHWLDVDTAAETAERKEQHA